MSKGTQERHPAKHLAYPLTFPRGYGAAGKVFNVVETAERAVSILTRFYNGRLPS